MARSALSALVLGLVGCATPAKFLGPQPLKSDQIAFVTPFFNSDGPFSPEACQKLAKFAWPPTEGLREIGQALWHWRCAADPKKHKELFLTDLEKSSRFAKTYLAWAKPAVRRTVSVRDDAQLLSLEAQLTDSLVEKKTALEKLWQLLPALRSLGESEEILRTFHHQVLTELVWLDPQMPDSLTNALLLRRERMFKASDEMLQRLAKAAPQARERLQALAEWRQNSKIAGQRNVHLVRAQQVSQTAWQEHRQAPTPESKELWVKAALTQARALWTEEKATEAHRILRKIVRLAPELAQDTYFVLGRMAEERGAIHKAEGHFQKSLSLDPSRDLQAKIYWQLAWLKYRQGQWREAQRLFLNQAEALDHPLDKLRARFWGAMAVNRTEKQGPEIWWEFFRQDPFGYYGQMSLVIAEQDLPGIAVSATEKKATPPMDLTLKTLMQLTSFQVQDARQINRPQQLFKDQLESLNSLGISEKIHLYFDIKLYKEAILLWTRLPVSERNELLESRPADFYPQPFSSSVLLAFEKTGTPTPVIYSIMRQESLYQVEARSPVDAFGLMQILPKHSALPVHHHEDLYEPNLNILSGSRLLRSLYERYGSWILSFCAYNGSERATDRWRERYKTLSPMEFIESIPYEETRTYAKTVLRNWLIYSRLELKGGFTVPKDVMLSL